MNGTTISPPSAGPGARPPASWVGRPGAAVAIVFLVSVAAYLNTLSHGFVYDDIPQVVRNPWLRDLSALLRAFTSGVWSFEGTGSNYYRPLMHVIYAVCWQLFGLSPLAYHAVNVLFHGGTAVLVCLFLGRLAGGPAGAGRHVIAAPAFAGALLFAIHPINTEAVAWISALPELSCAFFVLLCCLLHVGAREGAGGVRRVGLLPAAAFFLAALCKETALVTPFLLLACDLLVRRPRNRPTHQAAERAARYIPVLLAAAAYIALRIAALGAVAPLARHADMGRSEIAANAVFLFAGHLRRLFWPVRLSAYHVFEPAGSLLAPGGILALAIALLFGALCLLAARWNTTVLLGQIFVAAPLLPVLYIPALGENPLAERYLYLPSVGLAIVVAGLLSRLRGRDGVRRAAVLAMALAALLLFVATSRRNAVWKDDLTLWTDAALKSPQGAVPHYNLGCHLMAAGRLDEAIDQFRAAIRIQPAGVAHKSLGAALEAKGMLPEARVAYEEALRMEPMDPEARYKLGMLLLRSGRAPEAVVQLQVAAGLAGSNAQYQEGLKLAQETLRKQAGGGPR